MSYNFSVVLDMKRVATNFFLKLLNFDQTSALAKFGQMLRFCSLFYSVTMSWCIMSSCQKVFRSIRNITLKLCGVCVEQDEKDTRNCEVNYYDNAQVHTSLLVRDFIRKKYHRCPSHRIHRIWFSATFSCSKNWKESRTDGSLPLLRRCIPHGPTSSNLIAEVLRGLQKAPRGATIT